MKDFDLVLEPSHHVGWDWAKCRRLYLVLERRARDSSSRAIEALPPFGRCNSLRRQPSRTDAVERLLPSP